MTLKLSKRKTNQTLALKSYNLPQLSNWRTGHSDIYLGHHSGSKKKPQEGYWQSNESQDVRETYSGLKTRTRVRYLTQHIIKI